MSLASLLPAEPDSTTITALEAQITVPPQGGYVAFTCPDVVSKNNDVTYDPQLQDLPSSADQGRMDEGRAFETWLGQQWQNTLGPKIIMIPECDRSTESKTLREQLTMQAMREPGDAVVIWNARIPAILEQRPPAKDDGSTGPHVLPRIAEPDFLVLHGRRDDGNPIWAPGDVKHHKTFEGTTSGRQWPVSTLDQPVFAGAVLRDMGVGTPKVKPSKQLAHYRRVLEHYGFAQQPGDGEPYWACTVGKEGVLIWRDLDAVVGRSKTSVQQQYDDAFAHRIRVIRRAKARALNPAVAPLTMPDWCEDCKTGPWRTVIHDELKMDYDHIALLQGVTPERLKSHAFVGISTVADLARLDHPTATAVDLGLNVPELIEQAKAVLVTSAPVEVLLKKSVKRAGWVEALHSAGVRTVADVAAMCPTTAGYAETKLRNLAPTIDVARVAKLGQVCRARGVDWVDIPRATFEVDVDIEDADEMVYLIGARDRWSRKRGGDEKVRVKMNSFVFWEHTDEAEAANFAAFWQYVVRLRAYAKENRYGIRFYHYTSKEVSSFKMLARKHEGRPGVPPVAQLEALFDSNDWVDMFPIIRDQLIWPTESLSLKKVGKAGPSFQWRDDDPGGDQSIAWYREAIHHSDPAVREANRQRIVLYNEDDVIAQEELRNWIAKFGEARKPGLKLPSVTDLDLRFRRSARPVLRSVA